MLKWALIFLIIAVTAGLIGFTNVAAAAVGVAKVVFLISIVLFVGAFALALFRARKRNR